MKHKRRKSLYQTQPMARTQVWHSRPQEMLPAALSNALMSNPGMRNWATEIGMAVLSELIGAGCTSVADSNQQRRPQGPSRAPASSRRPAPPASVPTPRSAEVIEGLAVGDLLLDKYRIERIIGVGGMGVVVAAQHIHLKKRVAVKLLQPEAGLNTENLSRFIREAQLVARMQSEHVARMLDVGTLDSGIPYMVMEYLEGKDLFDWLEERGPLPVKQAVGFILQACEGIAEAHDLGIVHRDLKPANLFCAMCAGGEIMIKVLDFGISKVMDAGSHELGVELTQMHAVLGSPPYMSPEQTWSTRDVDSRTDIWALGVILYELLTRSLPFSGRTELDMRMKIATQPPSSLRHRHPEIPQELERVVLKCLEKDRDDRYPTVGDLAQALKPFASRTPPRLEPLAHTHGGSARLLFLAVVLGLLAAQYSSCSSRRPGHMSMWSLTADAVGNDVGER